MFYIKSVLENTQLLLKHGT